jgi:hypothetical protein
MPGVRYLLRGEPWIPARDKQDEAAWASGSDKLVRGPSLIDMALRDHSRRTAVGSHGRRHRGRQCPASPPWARPGIFTVRSTRKATRSISTCQRVKHHGGQAVPEQSAQRAWGLGRRRRRSTPTRHRPRGLRSRTSKRRVAPSEFAFCLG